MKSHNTRMEDIQAAMKPYGEFSRFPCMKEVQLLHTYQHISKMHNAFISQLQQNMCDIFTTSSRFFFKMTRLRSHGRAIITTQTRSLSRRITWRISQRNCNRQTVHRASQWRWMLLSSQAVDTFAGSNLFPAIQYCQRPLFAVLMKRLEYPAEFVSHSIHQGCQRMACCEISTNQNISMNNVVEGWCPHPPHSDQFPVRLAFSVNINKAQGQCLELCGLDRDN